MAKITVHPDCNNAPKKAFIRDLEVAFAEGKIDFLIESFDQDIRWEMVGDKVINGIESAAQEINTMVDGSIQELVIEDIITHGDSGAAYGTMTFNDGNCFAYCDIFTFTSHANDAKIKKMSSFVIPQKKSQ
jgi:hypothetical protein